MNLRRTILVPLVFLISTFFLIGNVVARTHEFIIQPKEEVTLDTPILTSPDKVIGNVSAQNGFVDFYVTTPTGSILFCYNKTNDANFNFTASETGNYTFHFINSLSAENVTGVLNYRIEFNVILQENVNVGFSVGTVTVITPQPILPPKRPPQLDNRHKKFWEKYLNLQEAEKIIEITRDVWTYMPLGPIIGLFGLTLLATPLFCEVIHRFRRQKSTKGLLIDITSSAMNGSLPQ